MTIDEIKKIDLVSYLSKCGITPKRSSGKYSFYLSPFGKETVPSFCVNRNKNTFKDYHSQNSGSILDFVLAYNPHLRTIGDAKRFLEGNNVSDIKQYTPQKKQAEGVKIHSVSHIADPELLDYACGVRKIDEAVLHTYCKEIEISFPYSEKDKIRRYKLIAFKSDLGGYECRNSWMRVCAGAKSHTTIKGKSKEKLILTEGFFDVLSYFTYYGALEPEYTMYCLNGAGQFEALNKFIGSTPVLYYGDNDTVGSRLLEQMENVEDKRLLYAFHKDFNSFLCS